MCVCISVCQAEILSVLSHRNIIQFYGAIDEAPNYGIVIGKLLLLGKNNPNNALLKSQPLQRDNK